MDAVEKIEGALVQHGLESRRAYVMKLGRARPGPLIRALGRLAEREGYTKIFVKAPLLEAEPFLAAGYEAEARVPGLYQGRITGLFLGLFLDEARREEADKADYERVLALAMARQGSRPLTLEARQTPVRGLGPDDAETLAALYRNVFASYPFPIQDPGYIRRTMESHVAYYGVEEDGELAAAASAEMDEEAGNVEMTDFATRPAHRGRGLARALLARMERDMAARGLFTAYTIARAGEAGMNITFAASGYALAGRLVNNTNIAGGIESMNIWHAPL